ncbi:phosphotransferase enzyme family protein [Streptomyces sp. NPDC048331]|uniref:phosphotransferase enzyme family protein n=1 Tax=Streptomyces sp. NPDC048331 TaxID=3365534 RepID=UPI00371AA678
MRQPKPLPAAVRAWAEQRTGPVVSVRDASHGWDRSRVWELEGSDGVHRYLKISPSVKFFSRESRAYRHIVPALGHSRAPQLIDSRAQDLALLLTAVPGAPAKELGLDDAGWRSVHQQAGALCARLHEAGELHPADRVEAEASLAAAADGAEKYLTRAGDRLTAAEQQLVRDHAARLRRIGPLPVCYIHGDNQPRNWMVSGSGSGFALLDFERTRPAARVQDLVILTVTHWADHPDRKTAFLRAYGRRLTDAEEHALRCLTAMDAVNCLVWGPDNEDAEVTARGRRTLDRLMREAAPQRTDGGRPS